VSIIAQTEDCIVAAIKTLLGNKVKDVASVPASLSAEELVDRLRLAPAVYVGFLGGDDVSTDTNTILAAKFAVYALTENAAGEKARRRGDGSPLGIGAYDIIEAVLPTLNGMSITAGAPPAPVPGAGTLYLEQVFNLWAEELDRKGVSLYSAAFKVNLELATPGADALAPFTSFQAQWQDPSESGETPPIAGDALTPTDKVILPQS
jgi:phage gp37-like protein